ncbi:protein phosphatase 2C domain-containing protein [Paludisphaera sp.]|uniref:PP2C family protein-serine/threonine phosphatase n=1 Tax=Paludisphaera sp. TaxID=2017432 RepID=UPI00301D410F
MSVNIETSQYEFLVDPRGRSSRSASKGPHSTSVTLDLAATSHPGKVRNRNEDHYMACRVSRDMEVLMDNLPAGEVPRDVGEVGYCMVVADGMGGMNAGDVASMMAISTGVRLADRSVKWGFKINEREARELLERISRYFQEIDRRLTDASESDRRLFGMGTTMTLAYSVGEHLFLVHLGDSRAYLWRGGAMTRLTRDHTVAQALADAGEIRPDEIRAHPRRHVLTGYLGGHHGKVRADVRWVRLRDGDRLLLCSDGLTDMVGDDAILEVLDRREDSKRTADLLLDRALEAGGKDNITVVLAGYSMPTDDPPPIERLDAAAGGGPNPLDDTGEFPRPG